MSKPTSTATIPFRLVKVLDISYVTTLYFVLACAISIPLDKLFGKFDPKKADKKHLSVLFSEIILHAWLLGAIIYFGRNIVELIPSPFEGMQGLVHSKLKELGNGAIFTYFLIFYQKYLRDKMLYVQSRLSE